MNYPPDLRYSSDHEWARLEDQLVRVGITDYAQDALGDVVFVEVPTTGRTVAAGEAIAEVESTKSVSEIYAPVAGTIVEANDELGASPERINDDPYGDGWICVLQPSEPGDLDALMDSAAYEALVDGQAATGA
jgi:glycine cleavage system H protein